MLLRILFSTTFLIVRPVVLTDWIDYIFYSLRKCMTATQLLQSINHPLLQPCMFCTSTVLCPSGGGSGCEAVVSKHRVK